MTDFESAHVLHHQVQSRVPGNRVRKFPLTNHRAAAPLVGERGSSVGRLECGRKGVWTMSTFRASDRVVPGSDRAGFRMFPRLPSVCRDWNAVRVPPRAQCFRRSGGLWPSDCAHIFFSGPLRGPFCWRPLLVRMAPFPWVRRRLWACYFFMIVRGLGSMTRLGGEKGCLPPRISCSAARAPDVSVRFVRRSDSGVTAGFEGPECNWGNRERLKVSGGNKRRRSGERNFGS